MKQDIAIFAVFWSISAFLVLLAARMAGLI